MDIDNSALRILIVDDTIENIQVLGTVLRQQEYKINVAQNGMQALQVLEKVRPDLILLDIMMPELDGFETCKRLKENPGTADIPVIFLTAKTETEDIVHGFELGAVDYVTKPFNATELLARVKTHLSMHILQAALRHSLQDIARMQREQEAFLKRELQVRLEPLQSGVAALGAISELLSSESQAQLRAVEDGVRGLSGLVDQMQRLQAVESGSLEVEKESVDLAQLVGDAVAELRTVYGGLVQIALENALPNPQVAVDGKLMSGAIQSLLQHAVEHVAVLEENVVTVHLGDDGGQALVNVRYGGKAVPPERLATFFEKFSAEMPHTDGTGLETNYAYLVTAAHGGEITVVSDEASGTTVSVRLPRA